MQNNYISEDAYYNKINKNPVYVVLMNGGTPLSKIISGFTGDTYTHACIAFNAKLKPLYSFGLTSESTFGFAVADTKDIKAFPHIDKYAVYVMYVSNHQLYKMKKRLKWFMGNKDNLKFDFPALVSVFFQKDTENHIDKYFCSRFVSEILKIGEVDLKKKASLYRPESLLELSNISLVNWGRDILHYNWIKTRDNERLIKANKYVNPKNLIPKFESGGNDLYEETHWDTLLTKPKLYFNKKVTMYHYSNTNKDIVVPLTVNAGNKLAKPRFSSWWTPYKSNAGWALSNVIFNTFKESKWKDVLWHVEEMTIGGMTYRAPKTIINESFYKSHEDFIKSIDVYEHQKTFNGSDLGRGNEYSVDEYTCDFAVKPDIVRRLSWDEMLEVIKIVPDDEFQLYRKELNDMWVHGKSFQDLVHEKKPWLYWEFDVSNDIRARYCKEHNIQFKIDEVYFRFTYHGGGIYEALKQHISPNVWRRLLTSSNFKWLPKPDYYSDTCTSWFTKEGKDQFVKKVLPICEKYLGDEVEYTKVKDLKNIVYKDRYQVVVDPIRNTNESVVYDDRDFDDILEEDSKYDYDNHLYGKEYARNLHKVDILKTRLKQGKITQEEFDKEYEKINPSGRFKIKPSKDGAEKVEYKRPNKNKPEGSAKKLYKGNPDGPRVDGDLSKSDGEKFDHYNDILQRTENYNDYKTAFKNMARLLGKPNTSAIKVDPDSFEGHVNARCYTSKKSANCTADTKLYHTSETKGLTRLNGKFRSKDGICYSSKRVYFHKGKPGSRVGESHNVGKNEYVYEFIGNPSQAYVDPELNGTAVFIETDTSVPVKDVTDQFKNKENKENKETKESVIYDERDFDTILEDSYDIRVRKAMRHKNNTRLFIISKQKLGDTLKPKSYKVNGKQENICILTHSIQHALMMLGEFCLGKEYFVYQTEDTYDLYNPKDDERIYPKCVSEVWIKSPVKISYMKKIKVTRDMFYPKYRNNPPEDIRSINNPYAWNTIETGVQHDSTWIKESGSIIKKSSNPLLNNIIDFDDILEEDSKYDFEDEGKPVTENIETRLSTSPFESEITLYHGSHYQKPLKVINPLSRNVGTKLSSPRLSSFWISDKTKAMEFAIFKLVTEYVCPAIFNPETGEIITLEDISDREVLKHIMFKKAYIYTKTLSKKYVGRGHAVHMNEFTIDVPVAPDITEEIPKQFMKSYILGSVKYIGTSDKEEQKNIIAKMLKDGEKKTSIKTRWMYHNNGVYNKLNKELKELKTSILESYMESKQIISYSKSFNDVKNVVDSLTKKELSDICNGKFKDSPYVIYRNVLHYKGDPAAFIDIYKLDDDPSYSGCIVIACKSKYRRMGFTTMLIETMKNDKDFEWSRLIWECKKNNKNSELFAKNLGLKLTDSNNGKLEFSMYNEKSEKYSKNPNDFSDYKLEETMLYEFANKELLDKIHVTSDVELSKWMKSNIKYQEFKKLMTPEEVFESKRGSCHDQVVFELAVLKALKYSPKTLFFIEYNDGETVGGQTHSLVYYRRGNKFFWFENAWGDQAGIHGPYKNVTELKNDIISKHDTKKYKKLEFSSFRGKVGMTLDELVKACLK